MFSVAVCDDDELLCEKIEACLTAYRPEGLIRKVENQEEPVVKGNENIGRKQGNELEKVRVSFSPEAIHIFDQGSGERIDEKSVLRKMYEGGAL